MKTLVLSISEVNAAMTRSIPPYLILHVSGIVPTTGWSQAELVPAVYITEPEDGIWEFQLIATSPTGIVGQVLMPISANLTVVLPRWCRGVRVSASTNEVEQMLFEGEAPKDSDFVKAETFFNENETNSSSERDPGDAWPWLTSARTIELSEERKTTLLSHAEKAGHSELRVDSLIGRKIRVVPKGGVITYDLHPNRVTFLLDEQGYIEHWLPF